MTTKDNPITEKYAFPVVQHVSEEQAYEMVPRLKPLIEELRQQGAQVVISAVITLEISKEDGLEHVRFGVNAPPWPRKETS